MNYNSVFRVRIIVVIVFLGALVVTGKLYYVQIAHGGEYRDKALKQYVKPASSTFDRGSIFFTSKDDVKIAAATIKEGYSLSINPKLINNPENVYTALSQYLTLDKQSFIDKASKLNDSYEEIDKKLEKEVAEPIAALKIPGVYVQKENWRIYPGDSRAAQTIGLIGLDKNDALEGRYGLESYYQDILSRGSNSSNINFFAELFSGIKNTIFSSGSKEGDIVTTIEPTVQGFLEETIAATKNKWSSDSIGGIIMDPKTGEIYAMSSLPTFNPNDLTNIKDPKVFSNPLVENVYEMGSIIKPLSVASGIDFGTITAKSTYNDEGTLILNGRKISNYDGRARGPNTPIQEILSQSLNTGVAWISLKMGGEAFSKYFLSLGFGEKTGVDQPNEQKGIVKSLVTKRDVEIATAAYGQGIALTPIQTVTALSTLANGGVLVTPHLVKEIEYTDGDMETKKEPDPKRIFKTQTVNDVTQLLINVVDKALQHGNAKMDHYSIAAKTGTAQIADPVNGGYYSDRYLHSFFGYFPAYNPRFIIFLYHVYPKNVEYASETLTDPFIKLTKLLLNYYDIPPDR